MEWINILNAILKLFKEIINIFILLKELFRKMKINHKKNVTTVSDKDTEGTDNITSDENSEISEKKIEAT